MKDILSNSEFTYIDFMIIDVEGSELSLLHSIDFTFPIFCIIIEAHSDEQEKNKIFGEFLKKNGFTFKERQRCNEVWINHNYFRVDLFNVKQKNDKDILQKYNKNIINLIKSKDKFMISRFGTLETSYLASKLKNSKIEESLKRIFVKQNNQMSINAGIYNINFSNEKLLIDIYCNCLKNSNFNAIIYDFNDNQDVLNEKFNLKNIQARSLEPLYHILQNEIPWTHYLVDKKVLIIHPFIKSFKKQLENKFKMFENKNIFLENQKFVFYKAYQTSGNNHIHKDWKETYDIMCKDISKLDFDIALLGCGGYGPLLQEFIYTKLNKSSIYMGGGLHITFGVMGERWVNHDIIGKIIRENGKFIRPSGDEIIKDKKLIENGCYW